MTPPPNQPDTPVESPADQSGDPDMNLLVSLCRRWDEARSAGAPVLPEDLCAGRPDLLPDLLRAIEVLRALDPANATTVPERIADPRLPRLPGYDVLGELGRGGMGAVYSARHRALNRVVAVKVLADAGGAPATRHARFQQEAEAVARLQHPNIVQIFEAGVADGQPFLALEYVDGGTLRGRTAGVPQPPRDAARLVETVARAVHHAHAAGIVHRDLKPANILLTTAGVPKVADFGLARSLDNSAGLTLSEDFLGTPAYAAPEQVQNRAADIGPATDVYSLGATLYELLTGRPPFEAGSLPELLRRVTDTDPTPLRRLRPDLPSDLETVCQKCLDKNPARRYPSALALAEDLRRFLADEPILARPIGPLGHGRRWARRNPAVAGLLAAIGLVLTAAAIGGAVLSLSLADALTGAKRDRDRAVKAEEEGQRKLFAAYVSEANAIRSTGQPGQRFLALDKIREALALGKKIELTPADWLAARNAATAALCQPDLCPGPDWSAGTPTDGVPPEVVAYVRTRQFRPPGNTVPEPVRAVSPTGRFAVVAPSTWVPLVDNPFEVWRLDGPTPVRVLADAGGINQNAVAFSPDERKVAVGRRDRTVTIYATADGHELARFRAASVHMWRLVWHPDCEKLAVILGDESGIASEHQVWDTAAKPSAVWATVRHAMITGGAAFHPSGKLLATTGGDGFIRLWELPTGRPISSWRTKLGGGSSIAFDHTGDLIIGTDWARTQRVWDVGTGRELAQLAPGTGSLGSAADGRSGAPSLHDGWYFDNRLSGGRERWALNRPLADGFEPATWITPHPNGRLLVMATASGLAFVDLATGRTVTTVACPNTYWFQFDAQGALWTYCGGGEISPLLRWPVSADPAAPHRLTIGPPEYVAMNFVSDVFSTSADGRVAVPGRANGAQVIRPGHPPEVRTFGPQDDVRTATLSTDGRLLATSTFYTNDESGVRIKVWEVATGRHLATVPVGQAFLPTSFSPDGRWMYTEGGPAPGSRRWDLSAVGENMVPQWEVAPQRPNGGLSPDGRIVARQPDVNGISLRDATDDRELVRLPLLGGFTRWCWSADSSRLFVVGKEDGKLYAYDLRLIRRGLAELGLDWDHPQYKPTPAWETDRATPALEVRAIGAAAAASPQQLAVAERARAVAELAVDPLDPDARRRLGLWLLNDSRPADAYPHLAAAAALDPRQTAVCLPLAEAGIRTGQWAEAVAATERAIAADPADFRLHRLRGWAEAGRGRHEEAAAALTAALEGAIGRGEQMPLLFARAAAYRAAGKIEAADADIRLAENIAKTASATTLSSTARALTIGPPMWRDPPRALALIHDALAREPERWILQTMLGVALYRNGQYEKALAALQKSRDIGRGALDGYDLFFQAMCYHRLGDKANARRSFDAAVAWAARASHLSGPERIVLSEFRKEAEVELAIPR